jgi:hypothetical protein
MELQWFFQRVMGMAGGVGVDWPSRSEVSEYEDFEDEEEELEDLEFEEEEDGYSLGGGEGEREGEGEELAV